VPLHRLPEHRAGRASGSGQAKLSVLGQAVRRREDPRLVRGRGRYLDDISLPGTLYCRFVRSYYGAARITGINTEQALEKPGVVAVATGNELELEVETVAFLPGQLTPRQPVLAQTEVRYMGEPVAAVIAETRHQAEDAVEAVLVDYEPLSAVVDPVSALEADATLVHDSLGTNRCFSYHVGAAEINDVFAAADVVVKHRQRINRITASPLEGRGVLAWYDPVEDTLTAWASTQIPFAQREMFAQAAGLPEHRVRVIAPDLGGAFGQKLNTYREELVCVALARRLGVPVKWVEERSENFEGGCQARDQHQEIELAARRDGVVTGLRFRIIADVGAYLQTQTTAVPALTGLLASGAYSIPAVSGDVIGVFTNKTPTDAYRGAGKPEAAFLIERMIDLLAMELELDPAEVRARNFIAAESFPYVTATGMEYDSGNYAHVLERALERARYDELRREQAEAREAGRLVGIGLSTYVELASFGPSDACGRLFGMAAPGFETANVRVLPSGKVLALSGSIPSGQGHATAWAQIVADQLQIPFEDVEVRFGDTESLSYGVGTFGSRSAVIGGTALKLCTDKILEKARVLAGHWLEVSPEDLELRDGRISVVGSPQRGMSLQEIARAAHTGQGFPAGVEPGLEATSYFDPPNFTFPFGAHVAVVEIDPVSGRIEIQRYVAVDDYGNVINPMLVEGQLHGGIAQGIGQALCEEVIYDADGQLLTRSYIDYLLPTSESTPTIESDLVHTPSPVNPLGVKGCGESGATGAPAAIANAVIDALRPRNVRHLDMPLRPEKVWRALAAR
jgi:carbon-monoxide dehydrogenase large subunit